MVLQSNNDNLAMQIISNDIEFAFFETCNGNQIIEFAFLVMIKTQGALDGKNLFFLLHIQHIKYEYNLPTNPFLKKKRK